MRRFRRLLIVIVVMSTFAAANPAVASDVAIEPVATGFSSPVQALSPEGDARVFVVEKAGLIRIVETDGSIRGTPFLDVSSLVSTTGEQGLLGLAFHPNWPGDPRFFVNYTNTAGDTQVVEYQTGSDPNRADTASARTIIWVDQPYTNHNGGMLAFGPDGYLYVGLGDGGSANDPHREAQNNTSLLGSMLRLDVSKDDFPGDSLRNYGIPATNPFVGKTGADEIFAFGLRNPWRFSFDGNLVFIGDVGQAVREEVSVINVTTDGGANLGWRAWEGDVCTGLESCSGSFHPPALSYAHTEGCSVTGGVVARASGLPDLQGQYLYSDFCSGWIRSFASGPGAASGLRDWTNTLGTFTRVVSFGTDGSGEVLITELGGSVWRITEGADRIFGTDRYSTAVAISHDAFSPGVPVVYVATGAAFPDALTAAAAAGTAGGPVLLVPPAGTPTAVSAEINRLKPTEIVIVGGPAAVPDATMQDLATLAPTRRIGGIDRFDTAARLALDAFSAGIPVAYVATGRDFPDALAAAARAGAENGPVLLSDTASLPSATRTALTTLAPRKIVVVGGPAVVSDGVVTALSAIAPVQRVWGADRYATAAALSAGVPSAGHVYVATGLNYPDALAAAAAAGHAGVPLLLTQTNGVPGSTAAELARLHPGRVIAIGGNSVIAAATSRQLYLAAQ
jgi:putative cell wall-binding protein/glucose/arabinose dehydrogenase